MKTRALLIEIYFAFSLISLCVNTEKTPLIIIGGLFLNFSISATLVFIGQQKGWIKNLQR